MTNSQNWLLIGLGFGLGAGFMAVLREFLTWDHGRRLARQLGEARRRHASGAPAPGTLAAVPAAAATVTPLRADDTGTWLTEGPSEWDDSPLTDLFRPRRSGR